jgi:hypothetical protein
MIVPRNQRQAAAFGLAATLAPSVGPAVREAGRMAYNYMTQPPIAGTQRIQQIIRASHEPKNVDTYVNTGITANNYSTLLNPISQGTSGNNRTGRQVINNRLELRLSFDSDPSSLQDDMVRILVVRDKESRGAAPSIADVLQVNTTPYYSVVSPYNFDNVPSRFQILVDDQVLVPNRTSPTTTTSNLTRVVYNRLMNLNFKTHYYNTNAGNITDIDDGAVYLFVLSTTVTKVSSVWIAARMIFRDL